MAAEVGLHGLNIVIVPPGNTVLLRFPFPFSLSIPIAIIPS
jgi:hypothetical protein